MIACFFGRSGGDGLFECFDFHRSHARCVRKIHRQVGVLVHQLYDTSFVSILYFKHVKCSQLIHLHESQLRRHTLPLQQNMANFRHYRERRDQLLVQHFGRIVSLLVVLVVLSPNAIQNPVSAIIMFYHPSRDNPCSFPTGCRRPHAADKAGLLHDLISSLAFAERWTGLALINFVNG